MVSKTTIGLTCEVSQTDIQLRAATASTEHKFEADTGFLGSLRKEIGLKDWIVGVISECYQKTEVVCLELTVTSMTLSCPTRDVVASHCLRFRMPATKTPLFTLFGTARNVPSGDQLQKVL